LSWVTSDRPGSSWPGAGELGSGDQERDLPWHLAVWWWQAPGVACPKSRCAGCEPAALETERFPGCPPGSLMRAAVACRASATSAARIVSLIRRLSARSALGFNEAARRAFSETFSITQCDAVRKLAGIRPVRPGRP
jgi:hypothetical protein